MNDYSRNDPKGWCGDPKRGAAMGRPSVGTDDDTAKHFIGKLNVRRVRLDAGGYDKNGTYFGLGQPLYWISSKELDVDTMTRASGRGEALAKARRMFPKANIPGAPPPVSGKVLVVRFEVDNENEAVLSELERAADKLLDQGAFQNLIEEYMSDLYGSGEIEFASVSCALEDKEAEE